MNKTRLMMGSVFVGLLAGLALAVILVLGLGPNSAAPVAQANTTTLAVAQNVAQAAATATPAASAGKAANSQYGDLLAQNFATRLGVDQTRLNSAFTAAATDTIDQALRDGKMDANTANKLKTLTGQGFAAFFNANLRGSDKAGKEEYGTTAAANDSMGATASAVLPAVARTLGISEDALILALKQGQTLQALEQAHSVTDAQVQSAVLAAVRSMLNAGVSNNQWTQAEADATYTTFSENVAAFLAKITNVGNEDTKRIEDHPGSSTDGPQQAAFQAAATAADNAVAQLFGLTFDQLQGKLQGGDTLLGLERAHGVTEQQVQSAALAAGQAAITAGVKSQSWTQTVATAATQDWNANIANYLAKIRNSTPLPTMFDAAQTAVLGLLGLTPTQLQDALKAKQTLQTLEQAHGLTAQQVKDAAVVAGRKALTDGVQQGKWTQIQADDASLAFDETVDSFLANFVARSATGKK